MKFSASRLGRRTTTVVSATVLLALTVSACGSSTPIGSSGSSAAGPSAATGGTTDLTITLNFLAGGANASGFVMAKDKGLYSAAGLNVQIQEGQGSASTASLVASGSSQFGYVDTASQMAVAVKGGDVVNLAQVNQANGFSVISLKEKNITKLSDLAGKTIGTTAGTGQTNLFTALLKRNGVADGAVNIQNVDTSALVGSLLQGKVDAINGGADNQAIQLITKGAGINQILYRDAQVVTIGNSIVTSNAYAKANPEITKAFVAASLQGWEMALKDTQGSAEAVAKAFPTSADVPTFKAQLDADQDVICPKGGNLGKAPTENWKTTYELLKTYQELPDTKPVSDYYTNDYLPASLPSC